MRDNKELKGILRKEFLQKRNELANDFIEKASAKIVQRIVIHHLYNHSENILMYVPIKREVNIIPLIEHSWSIGKKVLIPKTNPLTKKMEPFLISSWEDTEIGNYQITEPKIKNKKPFFIDKIDLVIVPGLIFDWEGNRLGYGGGYYDRFFNGIPKLPYRIGVAYDFQLIDSLPTEGYDITMNEVITEKGHIILK